MNPSFTFNAETRVTYLVTATYDTVDQTLAAWESTQKQFAFDVFKILPSSSEVLSALLSATPDQPFSIVAFSKFSTNMDGKPGFEAYDKSTLQFTFACTNPASGSDVAAALTNNCCSLVFSWNSSTFTLTKNNVLYTKYCDGLYDISLTAKHPTFSTYSQTYSAKVKVKYDCGYLRSWSQYAVPSASLVHWIQGPSPSAVSHPEVTYTVGSD